MTGNRFFDQSKFIKWSDELGIGFLPLEETPYNQDYFDKYVRMAQTEMGKALNDARCAIVECYAKDLDLVDVGIGSGAFMDAMDCHGFDINPVALKMLIETRRYLDPYCNKVQCASFWDSLEHIADVERILANVADYIFVSLPIFDDLDHVRRSKHFRPDEHCWYFTKDGFQRFVEGHGFKVVSYGWIESELGREDIGTFVCKRES